MLVKNNAMASPFYFYSDVDFRQCQLLYPRLQNFSSAPSASGCVDGQLGYRASNDLRRILFFDSALSAWIGVPRIDYAETVTGLWTFDRDTSAPFAVTSGSAVVTNLDSDMLDGLHAAAAATPSTIAARDAAGQIKGADPTESDDLTTMSWVTNQIESRSPKDEVKISTTANITLSGTQTIDGYAVQAGDRVLVKDQSTASENGIYICASGAWSRATDADSWNDLISAYTWVEQGTANGDTGWLCTIDAGGTLGSTSVTWTQVSGSAAVNAGNGIVKVGSVIHAIQSTDYSLDSLVQTAGTTTLSLITKASFIANYLNGTANYLAKFTSANVVGDSVIYENSGSIGIGFTTTAAAKLSINGGLHVGGYSDPGDNNLLVDGTVEIDGGIINLDGTAGPYLQFRPGSGCTYWCFIKQSADVLQFGDNAGARLGMDAATGCFYPITTNVTDLGKTGQRFRTLYLGTNAHVSGNLGVGVDATTSYGIYTTKTFTNSDYSRGIFCQNTFVSSSGNSNNYGISLDLTPSYVTTGRTNAASWFGISSDAIISNANHLGTQASLYGARIQHGIVNCGVGGAVTNSYGCYVQGFRLAGTVTALWGYYETGHDKNYFASKTGFGTNAPAAQVAINGGLHVGGDTDPGDNNCIIDGTLSVGSAKFTVDASGNLTKVNDVTYSFPASQGSASTYLKNDGSGNLTWASVSAGGDIARKVVINITGVSGGGPVVLTHNLGTKDIHCTIRKAKAAETDTDFLGFCSFKAYDTNNVQVEFATPSNPADNDFVLTVIG